MNILRALHCVGVVTNGAVRSIPAAESAGFHFFAGSVSVSHAYVHIVEIGTPVEVGGLKIQSGDLLHGDLHGVQSIPLGHRRRRFRRSPRRLLARKQELIALCRVAGVLARKAPRRCCEREGLTALRHVNLPDVIAFNSFNLRTPCLAFPFAIRI